MERTLQILNSMQTKGLLHSYAIGGGIAALFYIEPITTFDLDIFVILPESSGPIISLSPLYVWLQKKGYPPRNEQVIIEGVPVQFIPVYNDLIKDAVNNAVEYTYGHTVTRVLGVEYLIAIMLQTYRAKDKERLIKFLDECDISPKSLNSILEKHNLKEKFERFRRKYYGQEF
jgi:hypothetical protein